MDRIRSCYSTLCNFGAGQVGEITWFWAHPKAKIFPGLHRFGSLNWLPAAIPDAGPGEILGAPRVWRNGSSPVVPLGQEPDGPVEDALTGNNPDHPYLTLNADGIPATCVPDPGGEYDSSYSPDFNT